MKRREFLKKGLYFTLFAAIRPFRFKTLLNVFSALPMEEPEVVIVRNGTPELLVKKALELLGGIDKFVSRGDVVVVKPNIGWDRTPAQSANTHPGVVRAIVQECLKMEPKVVKIFDFTCNDPRRCYNRSGIKDALEQISDPRVKIMFIDKRKFVQIKNNDALNLKEWTYYQDALEADKFINVPVAKHHGLTGLTLGMKNIMGVIGPNRGTIHKKIDQNLVDINRIIKSHLTIIDATRILVRNGPTGGNLADVEHKKTVIASKNVVSADSAATLLFGKEWTEFGWLKVAKEAGLGEPDLRKVKMKELDLAAKESF